MSTPATTPRQRAINAILDRVQDATNFYTITYNQTTQRPEIGAHVAPKSALVNETNSTFAPDKTNGRRLVLSRTNWSFELRMEWQQEVTLELFEDSLRDPVPVLPKTSESPSLQIEITGSRVIHPVQQGNSRGTEAIVAFRVIEGRV